MNITALASDIASRAKEMAKDTAINNAEMIERMINDEIGDYDVLLSRCRLLESEVELLAAKLRKATRELRGK